MLMKNKVVENLNGAMGVIDAHFWGDGSGIAYRYWRSYFLGDGITIFLE